MKITHDLNTLKWQVSGWTPYLWRFTNSIETGATCQAEIPDIPVQVPGSVQKALIQARIIEDWNIGMNARSCEWVENRHWMYTTLLPTEWFSGEHTHQLVCNGLDYSGWVFLDGQQIGEFKGTHTPHIFKIPETSSVAARRLQIIFDCPPRWLGQFGHTSQMTDWKPRFNYTWDWTARLVQTGIWDSIVIETHDGDVIKGLRCHATVNGSGSELFACATVPPHRSVALHLLTNGVIVHARVVSAHELGDGVMWRELAVERWHSVGRGAQHLYTLRCSLLGDNQELLDVQELSVGFRNVEWRQCTGADASSAPWLCVVNGDPLFLQGVNWTPIRPNFADVTDEQYHELLTQYRDLGCNLLRVWGGGFLEKEIFYNVCDELGLLVWQEIPLSSSGIDNWPPEDTESISQMCNITCSFIERRQHHPSLLLWCGGNELQGSPDGGKTGGGLPVTNSHPLIAACTNVAAAMDPHRRFLPTSSSGPTFTADAADFGKQIHWDVHGPWKLWGDESDWQEYWEHDDALFRSETGAPGASPLDILMWAAGTTSPGPCNNDNPLWRRMSWWIEEPEFIAEHGRTPVDPREYINWSQERQARALAVAAWSCKARFPRCGGFLVWMGHDSFPCPANTAIIDFWGRPKPAAIALQQVFRAAAGQNYSKE